MASAPNARPTSITSGASGLSFVALSAATWSPNVASGLSSVIVIA